MAITTRADKGSELTYNELDTNFTDLRDGVNPMVLGTSGTGIKVDSVGTPSFGWRDLIGDITPKTAGAGSPTLATLRAATGVRAFFYAVGEDGDCVFHIPHDYVPGSDLYLHAHWTHNGTAISGTFALTCYVSYAKGHQQANFSAEVAPVISVASLNLTNTPQLRHRVDEIQLSSSTPSATQLNSADIETDGLILIHFDVTTIPTITGSIGTPSQNKPAILTLDLHYQSSNLATKNKSPSFYV
jgi:hypothetical protein